MANIWTAAVTLSSAPIGRQGLKALGGTTFRVGSVLLSLAFGILGARLIGTQGFGVYVSLMSLAGLVSVAVSAGFPTLVAREIAAARGRRDGAVTRPLLDWSVWVLLGSAVLTLVLGIRFGAETALVLCFVLIGNGASLMGAVHVGWERVIFGAWVTSLVSPGVAVLALVVLAHFGEANTTGALLAQILGAASTLLIFTAVLGMPAIRSAVAQLRSWPRWSDTHARLLRAGLVLGGTQLLINATTQLDVLILTVLAGAQDVAHYFAAARAALVVSFFFGIAASFAEPSITRLFAEGNIEQTRKAVGNTAVLGFVSSVVAALVALMAAPFYLAFYGSSFLAAQPALQILVVGLIAWSMFGPAQVTLRATHQEGTLLKATLASVIVNGVIAICLVPHFGVIGAAIGTAAQFSVYGAMMAILSARTVAIRSDIFQLRYWSEALQRH